VEVSVKDLPGIQGGPFRGIALDMVNHLDPRLQGRTTTYIGPHVLSRTLPNRNHFLLAYPQAGRDFFGLQLLSGLSVAQHQDLSTVVLVVERITKYIREDFPEHERFNKAPNERWHLT